MSEDIGSNDLVYRLACLRLDMIKRFPIGEPCVQLPSGKILVNPDGSHPVMRMDDFIHLVSEIISDATIQVNEAKR